MRNIIFIIILVLSSCEKENNDRIMANCRSVIIVDNSVFYSNTSTQRFDIIECEISDNCIELEVTYGGCRSVDMDLIASKDVFETLPPQRDIRLSFPGAGDCERLIIQKYKFDLKKVQISGTNKIILNLKG